MLLLVPCLCRAADTNQAIEFNNTDISPANYAPKTRAGVLLHGKVGIAEPGGEVNFNYDGDSACEFKISSTQGVPAQLTIGDKLEGGVINITGSTPRLIVGAMLGRENDAHIVLDAKGKGSDKAVINIIDPLRREDSTQDFYVNMAKNASIDVIEGQLNFIDQHNINGDEWSSSVTVLGGTLTIHSAGLMNTGVSELWLGSQSSTYNTRLESWGNVVTPYLAVAKNAVAVEHADIVIDGVGGTGTTRGSLRLIYGGEYFGNVAIEGAYHLPEGHYHLIIHNGSLHGDVELRDGKIVMHDGAIDGSLSIRSGTVELWEKQFSTPPFMYYGKGIAMTGGSLELPGANIGSGGNISIANGAQAQIGALSNFNNKLLVGSASDGAGGASLSAERVELGPAGMLLMDPPWGLAPANAAIGVLGADGATSSSLQGKIGVGMNSMLAIGTSDLTWLPDAVNKASGGAGLSENGARSALGLFKPLQIASGGVLAVDGGKTSAQLETSLQSAPPNTATFASQSMLALNGQDEDLKNGAPALTFADGGGTVRVHNGAGIFISQAQPGTLYQVADTTANPIVYFSETGDMEITPDASTAWEGENLRASSDMISLTYKGDGLVEARANNAADVFPDLSRELAKVLNNLYSGLAEHPFADPQSPWGGIRFLSRATDNEWNGGASRRDSAGVLESAARMDVLGAVPQMAMAANNAAANAVAARLGPARQGFGLLSDEYDGTFGLWIMPLYQSANGFGLEAGHFSQDFSGSLGGVALGADWRFLENLRAGLSFNIGGGYARGGGDLATTKNNMNFWGFSVYGGWTPGDFGLFADFNLTSSYNELKQELPAFMDMAELQSDVTALALSAGLAAEYAFHCGDFNITPHAGVRYHYAHAYSHDITSGGKSIIDVDEFNQNFWTFPLGVAISANISLGGWNLKPGLDFVFTPAAGNLEAKTKLRFTGMDHQAQISTQIMDWAVYGGTAGIELSRNNISFSAAYSGQFGPHTSAHGVFAAFRYEF